MTFAAPGKRAFFKYASPETALAILRNRTVRYASPLTFNDPFDVQSGLHFNFEIDALPAKIINRLSEYASSPTSPPVDPNDVWGKLVLEVQRLFPTHGFPRERWEADAPALLRGLAAEIKATKEGYQKIWWDKLLPGARFFCVSEERDNLLMWAHYARDHTGAVFEFWSLPEEDNPLSVARPVQYLDDPPSFFSEDEFLDEIFSLKKLDTDGLYQRYAYAKSKHWKYEREWRAWYPLSESGLHDDMPIRPTEFLALYLGCRAKPEFKAALLKLVCEAFPNVRVFQATRLRETYSLDYTEI